MPCCRLTSALTADEEAAAPAPAPSLEGSDADAESDYDYEEEVNADALAAGMYPNAQVGPLNHLKSTSHHIIAYWPAVHK